MGVFFLPDFSTAVVPSAAPPRRATPRCQRLPTPRPPSRAKFTEPCLESAHYICRYKSRISILKTRSLCSSQEQRNGALGGACSETVELGDRSQWQPQSLLRDSQDEARVDSCATLSTAWRCDIGIGYRLYSVCATDCSRLPSSKRIADEKSPRQTAVPCETGIA